MSHKIERASFGLLNEGGDIVIGGQSEIAAFDPVSGRQLWRARHTPPGRGIFRTVAAIAARAASLYFRFGGPAMTAFRGVQIARTVTSLSWSGLASRSSFSNLQALATASKSTSDVRHVSSSSGSHGVSGSDRSVTTTRSSVAFSLASRAARDAARAMDVFLHRASIAVGMDSRE